MRRMFMTTRGNHIRLMSTIFLRLFQSIKHRLWLVFLRNRLRESLHTNRIKFFGHNKVATTRLRENFILCKLTLQRSYTYPQDISRPHSRTSGDHFRIAVTPHPLPGMCMFFFIFSQKYREINRKFPNKKDDLCDRLSLIPFL